MINKLALNNLNSLQHIKELTKALNLVIPKVNKFNNINVKGPVGTFIKKTANSVNINIPAIPDAGIDLFVAKIDSDATGGGYYNCYLQKLDAGDDWNTNDADVFVKDDEDDETIVVLNMEEHNSTTHDLSSDDFLICWEIDDEAELNAQDDTYIGISVTAAGIKRAAIVSINDDHYTLNSGASNFNVYTFTQGQDDWDFNTNVIPRFKVGNYLPYYKIGSKRYIAQTFIYVGNNRSVRWVTDDGLVDDPNRAGAFFRDF